MGKGRLPRVLGNYILLDRIAVGGMAELFHAKQIGLTNVQRLLAIKCLLPSLVDDREFVAMFVDEAKLAAQLSHPNIVQILELGRSQKQFFIVMELLSGRNLRHITRLAQDLRQAIPLPFAAYVVARAADALAYAHNRLGKDGKPLEVVHRDVSPHNVLVTFDGQVKLVDFGIARARDRQIQTDAGVLKGKYAYMAPEQLTGCQVDARTDIFALGALLYELVTTEQLFAGKTDRSVVEKVKEAKIPVLAGPGSAYPKQLDTILQRALARDPPQRYQQASEMADHLSTLLIEGQQIFSRRQAAAFMGSLYADDIERLAVEMTKYEAVGVDLCVEGNGEDPDTRIARPRRPGKSTPPAGDVTASHEQPISEVTAPGRMLKDDALGSWYRDTAIDGPTQPSARSHRESKPHPPPTPDPQDAAQRSQADQERLHRSGERRARKRARRRDARHSLVPGAVAFALAGISALALVWEELRPSAASGQAEIPVGLTAEQSWTPPLPGEAPVGAPDPPVARPPSALSDQEPACAKGFLWVRVKGIETAKVFVDNKEAGYSPLTHYRLPVGPHRLKVIEELGDGELGRVVELRVTITAGHTRASPKRIVIPATRFQRSHGPHDMVPR